MIYCFDIDGVVCETINGDYEKATPIIDRIKKINELYKKHTIIFNTSRGAKTGIDWHDLTTKQFENWGLKHHLILFTKPFAHYYIDDKNLLLEQFDK